MTIPYLGTYSSQKKAYVYTNLYTNDHNSIIYSSPKCKQPRLERGEWMKQLQYIQTMKYYSVINEKNKSKNTFDNR